MATRKSGQTLAALNAGIAKLQAQADALRSREVAGVVARIREAILRHGLTAADLDLDGPTPRTSKGVAAVGSLKTRGKTSGRKPARTIKFTDGQGQTWSGIGKRPNWFKAALATGKKAKELLAPTQT